MRRASFAVVAAAAVFAVQSCGGGSSTSPYGMNTGPAGGGGGGGGTPAHANVSIVEYSFGPSAVTITRGGSVTWNNDGTVAHTVTADSGGFSSGQLASATGGGAYGGGGTAGGSYTYTFTLPGTYTYHCSNHPTMTGSVTVQ